MLYAKLWKLETMLIQLETLQFEYAENFHISHFTNHLTHFILIDHKWKLSKIFWWVILNVIFMLNSMNQPKLPIFKN